MREKLGNFEYEEENRETNRHQKEYRELIELENHARYEG